MHTRTKKHLIHGVIALAICLIIWCIPPAAPLTTMGMRIIGLIAGLIYGLIAMEDPAIPSLGALILFGLSGYTTVQNAFAAAEGQFAVCLILSMLMIGGIMQSSGLAHVLAEKLANAKWANGKPWSLTLAILLATTIPSMFITPLPVAIVVWGILSNIYTITGFSKGDKWPALMITSVTACGVLASTAMPFNVAWLVNNGLYASMGGDGSYNSVIYLISSVLFCIVLDLLIWAVMRWIIRPDVSKLKNYKAQQSPPFTPDQKTALVLLVIFVVLALLPDLLPDGNIFSGFGVIGSAFITIFLAIVIRKKDGSPFITFQQIGSKGVIWSILAMIGSLMTICSCLSDSSLGIDAFLTNLVAPVTNLGPFLGYAVLLFLTIIGTNILDNSVVGLVAAAVLSMLHGGLAFEGVSLLIMLTHGAEFGVLLPASSPNGALTYGQVQGGWVDKKSIVKHGFIYMLLLYIVLLFVGYPFLSMFA